MKFFNDSMPWATILAGILVVVAAGVGGAVVIWGKPGALSFEQYLDLMKNFAIAVGILGIGRGIASFGKQNAQATMLSDTSVLKAAPPPAPGPGEPVAAGYGAGGGAAWDMPIEPEIDVFGGEDQPMPAVPIEG
jgi:hypothetical protein